MSESNKPNSRARRRWLRRACAATALGAVSAVVVASCRMVDEAAVRLSEPRRYELGKDARALTDHPDTGGMKTRRHTIVTADGLHLPLLVIEPLDGSAALTQRRVELAKHGAAPGENGKIRGTVLMLHGINSRKEHMLWTAQWLVAGGYRCIAWDSRGHGEADVAKATFGAKETDDTKLIYQFLERGHLLTGERLLYGHSMGAAVAAQWLPHHAEIRAVVLCAPFAKLSSVMRFQAASHSHGLMRPLVPLVRRKLVGEAHYDPYRINPVEWMPRIEAPVLFVHGAEDKVVPPAQSELLLKAAAHPASRRIVTTGGHNNPLSCGGPANHAEVVRFYQNKR